MKKTYSQSEKQAAIETALNNKRDLKIPHHQTAAILGIGKSTLAKWIQAYNRPKQYAIPSAVYEEFGVDPDEQERNLDLDIWELLAYHLPDDTKLGDFLVIKQTIKSMIEKHGEK